MTSVVVLSDATELVAALEAGGLLTVVRHVADAAEALSVVGSGLASVVICAGPASSVDAAFVEALHRVGGRGLALVATDVDGWRLQRWGMAVLPADASSKAVEQAVLALVAGESPTLLGLSAATAGTEHPGGAGAASGSSSVQLSGPQATRGRITTVWGTGGAPGRSTVALNLAVELALAGRRTVLVDADTYGASQATSLGLLDETAGIVRLCRGVDQGSFDPSTDSEAFARVRAAGAGFRLTSGLPRPERWAEISAPSLRRALAALARVCDEVVVDVAAPIGRDDELALDSFAPQRNDATLAALAGCDRLLAVGKGDPVSLPRLIRLCEEASLLPEGPAPRLVVNQVSAATSGLQPERAIRRAWERFGPQGFTPTLYLPWDQASTAAAVLKGRPLAEAAPRSALRRAIARLAA